MHELLVILQLLSDRLMSTRPATPALLQQYVAAELSQVSSALLVRLCTSCYKISTKLFLYIVKVVPV